jgi:hypothetical protein
MPPPIPIAIISPAEARLCCVGKEVGNGIAPAVASKPNKNAATAAGRIKMANALVVFTCLLLDPERNPQSKSHEQL